MITSEEMKKYAACDVTKCNKQELTDICSVERMKESVEKLGDKFLRRIFSEKEIEYCEARKMGRFESYSAKFAGKEAVFKALSPNKEQGGTFTEVEILNDEIGRPYVILHGELEKNFKNVQISVSLSHEKEYAIAMAVAEI